MTLLPCVGTGSNDPGLSVALDHDRRSDTCGRGITALRRLGALDGNASAIESKLPAVLARPDMSQHTARLRSVRTEVRMREC